MNYKLLAASASHLIVKRFLGPFRSRRKWLNKTQWLSADELSDIQFKLLKQTIQYANRNVPYYRKQMKKQGFLSEDIRSLADIRSFPILTKRDVINAGDTILSQNFPKFLLRHAHTGGTTGAPLSVYRSLFSIGNEHAFVRRQWDWAQIGFKDRCAYLRGSIIKESNLRNRRLYTYDPIMKELHLSSYHLTPEMVPIYIEAMKKHKVAALVGYPSAISFFARVCLARNRSLSLKSVLTSSEALTMSMREEISKAFACPVYDFYGGAERVCYIFTCEHGCYHIQPEYGYTELIPVNGPEDNTCRIVSTGFWNTPMPLIRYDTGDLVVKGSGPCRCGRAFPVIESVTGREGDVIKTPSGEELGVTIMIHLLYVICGAANILETQFIQDAPDHITVEYVPDEKFCADDFCTAQRKFIGYLANDITIDFKRVKAVQRTSSGKIRPVISLMPITTEENDFPVLTGKAEVCESKEGIT